MDFTGALLNYGFEAQAAIGIVAFIVAPQWRQGLVAEFISRRGAEVDLG